VNDTDRELTGWVFNIQHYSLHDGPGIRTTVFLMGCPLRCLWCSNPESQQLKPQILVENASCIRCDECLKTCSEGAIHVNEDGIRQIQTVRCTLCGECIEECYAGSLELVGQEMTVAEVLAEVEADQLFYDRSGGGMTLSGGDPIMQNGFSRALLRGAKALGIHTTMETSGHTTWKAWEFILPHLDLVLYDVKETALELHRQFTGVSNDLILENLKRLAKSDVSVIVRRPVIPGDNDSADSIHALGRLVRDLGNVEEIDLLPYHNFGRGKYAQLGMDYVMGDTPSMSHADVRDVQQILQSYGLQVRIGGA
jgi:pyruvate formate lyase activating enzyme